MKLGNYSEVLEIYPEGSTVQDMITLLSGVIAYLKEGDAWMKRNNANPAYDEIARMIAFTRELRDLTEAMSVAGTRGLTISYDGLKLNLEPWIDYVNKHGYAEMLSNLCVLRDTLIEYLNDGNIQDFKKYVKVVNTWEFGLNQVA